MKCSKELSVTAMGKAVVACRSTCDIFNTDQFKSREQQYAFGRMDSYMNNSHQKGVFIASRKMHTTHRHTLTIKTFLEELSSEVRKGRISRHCKRRVVLQMKAVQAIAHPLMLHRKAPPLPWRYTGKEENMEREDIKMLMKKWWDIYNDESLDCKEPAGLQPYRAAFSEAGVIHYITAPSAA